MLAMTTRVRGSPPASIAMASPSWVRNSGTGVIVSSEEVQASLAPMRIVT
jgi:hypothetical protein